jgi:hypothetical protein
LRPPTRRFSYWDNACSSVTGIEMWDPKARKWVRLTPYTQYTQSTDLYWNWGLCRGGTWIYRNNSFVLVLPRKFKFHHHLPVHWVRVGKATGFVPRNPADKKGQPPLNLKYGLFVPSKKPSDPAKLVQVKPSQPFKLLDDPPKQFREIASELPPAAKPEIQAQVLDLRSLGKSIGGGIDPKAGTLKVTYDYGKRAFIASGVAGSGSTRKPVLVASLDPRGGIPLGGSIWDRAVVPVGMIAKGGRGSSGSAGKALGAAGRGGASTGRSSASARSGGGDGRSSGGGSSYSGCAGSRGGGSSGAGSYSGGGSSGGGGGSNGRAR